MLELSVSKFYTDCVDRDGSVFIGYIGTVTWRKFNFHYSNFLFYDALNSEFKADYSIRKSPFPEWSYPLFKWTHPALKIEGEWKSLHAPVEEKLLRQDNKFINWSCLQPLTRAKVKLGDRSIEGLGYSEKLDLEIDPENLPFDTLRWGRFTADETSIVWIEWRGEIPLKLVYLNGVKYENVDISDESVEICDVGLELRLTERLELRKGSLLETVFKNLQWLIKKFPIKMLSTFECKWRSKGVLINKNGEKRVTSGWAIHEIVIWE